ncbi:hypothetical protein [Verrucomicrobium spinosum]|nr:hypothetical protein [Verrucomicrobium spinosum]
MPSSQKSRSTLLLIIAGIAVAAVVAVFIIRSSPDSASPAMPGKPIAEAPKPAQPVVDLGP